MKISTTIWVVLFFVLVLVGAVVLYFMYNDKLEARDQAEQEKDLAAVMLPALTSQKANLESQLADLEEEYAGLQQQIEDLNITLDVTEEDLENSQAELELAIQSIEYGETLYMLADETNIDLNSITYSGPDEEEISGIDYEFVTVNLNFAGYNDEILDFVDAIVNEEGFKTTVIEPVSVVIPPVPAPVEAEYDIEELRAKYRQMLITENLQEITAEIYVDIVQDIALNDFNIEITDNTMEESITIIHNKVALAINEFWAQIITEDLAGMIEQQISDQLDSLVVTYWGAKVANILVPEVDAILGGNMDIWMKEQVEGSIQGYVTSIVRDYMSAQIQSTIDEMVEPETAEVEALVQAEIVELEEAARLATPPPPKSSATLTLRIYTYPGGSNG